MITDLFNKDCSKILTFFSISPGSAFSRKEIQEKTILHNVQVDAALTTLEKNTIIHKDKRLYRLNFKNKEAKEIITLLKKEHLRFKELQLHIYYLCIDISATVSIPKKIDQVYLFGSYAKLIHTEKSDVDLAIIAEKENQATLQTNKIVAKLERKYNKTIELHLFTKKDLQSNDPLIKELKKNSIPFFEERDT